MTSYVAGNVTLQGFAAVTLEAIELRLLNQQIQQYNGGPASMEELRLMRNDIAFELGITPPIVPGQ